jgi:hypothetical protein
MTAISETLADAALAALCEQFKGVIEAGYEPKLFAPGDGPAGEYHVIVWEEGPYEWTYTAFVGGLDQEVYVLAKDAGATDEQARATATRKEVSAPEGVHVEAINHYSIGLYPAG